MKQRSTRRRYGRYQAHRWRMHGKQLEMEDALAEDWAHDTSAASEGCRVLMAAWKVERKGVNAAAAAGELGLDATRVEKWAKWLHGADEKARKGYLKRLCDADETTVAAVTRAYQDEYSQAAAKWDARWKNGGGSSR